MKLYAPVTKTVKTNELQGIICDKCGASMPDEIIGTAVGVSIDWSIYHAMERDGGGEATTYKADICRKCVLDVVTILKAGGVNITVEEMSF